MIVMIVKPQLGPLWCATVLKVARTKGCSWSFSGLLSASFHRSPH